MSCQSPRNPHSGIHLGWKMQTPQGRTLSQIKHEPRKMIGQQQPRSSPHYHKTWDCGPCGRAVLLVSLTLLPSTQAHIYYKIFCFVSKCVSLDISFQNVRQEPTLRLWKGPPFLQQKGIPQINLDLIPFIMPFVCNNSIINLSLI